MGLIYREKKRAPWYQVWKSQINYNRHMNSLGVYNDLLSASLVHELVRDKIEGDL
jgi:hypothetical protein